MSLSIGLIGLPNVGKSTLFNALTDADILAANYPFATIEPNTGVVPVPDARLAKLGELYQTKKLVPATVELIDIAGLVAGASKGEGLGNQFLANVRECACLVHVVRAFENSDILHVNQQIDPKRDIEVINTELMLADLQSLEKHLPKVQKLAKSEPKLNKKLAHLTFLQNELLLGRPVSTLPQADINPDESQDLRLLTAKPMIYVFNVNEAVIADPTKQAKILAQAGLSSPDRAHAIFINAQLEAELRGLTPSERREILAAYKITELGLDQLIKAAYTALKLQSFLTAGQKEVRAWTIPKGATAPQAAGAIHSDFTRGFIAAQVVNCQDLIQAGSESAAKAQGKVRTEGKTYVMQPDDVVEFRFNV